MEYTLPAGTFQYDHYGYTPEQVLSDAGGWPLAIVLADVNHPHERMLLASGGAEDQMAFAAITISAGEWEEVIGVCPACGANLKAAPCLHGCERGKARTTKAAS